MKLKEQKEQKSRIQTYKDEFAKWTKQNDFCLFGTFTWKYESRLNEAERKKALARFLNAMDRKMHKGKGVKEGKRVERFVFFEKGRSRTNLHAHIFFKSENLRQTKDIISQAQDFWKNRVTDAGGVQMEINCRGDERQAYGIKEYWYDNDEQFVAELSFLKT